MDVIYRKESAIKDQTKELERMVKRAEKLSSLWNKQQIMGPMGQHEFLNLIEHGVSYFMDSFRESIRRDEAKARGSAYYDLVDVTKFHPLPADGDEYFDVAKLDRLCQKMTDAGSNWGMISFKGGKPHVSKPVQDYIVDKNTIFAGPENKKILEQGQKDAQAINSLVERGYEITVGKPFVLKGGRYEFDVLTLKKGSGKALPKNPQVEPKEVPVINPVVVGTHQPVNITGGNVARIIRTTP